jgi:hypothetical protein
MISSKTSNDLFNKIRSKFGNIQIGNTMGEATANPGDAVFFDFDFQEEGDSFGRVSISLADGESVKVFYNQGLVEKLEEDDKTAWYAFLKELKDFAVTHQLGFDVRDITKSSLTKQDFKNIADTNQTVNTADMSEELNRIVKLSGLAESLTGTARSSFESLDKTRLIIRHSKAVDENIPGDRTRNINSLYIENSDGERFKYPVIHLAGARAMARHVANGGVPHDDFGKHIVGVSEQIAQLNSFSRYTANKDQLNDSAGDIIKQAKMKLETMRKYVKGLSKQKNYEAIKETFQPSAIAELDDATKDSLREKFTLKHMDDRVESALPLLHSIMQEFDKPEDEIPDPEMDAPISAKDAEIPAPVSAAPLVQQYLSDPENKLVLRKDDSADAMLKRTKFTTKNGMLSSILSDIASRMLTKTPDQDRVANFASQIANDIGREGTPFFDVTKDYIANKKIAFQLAKRYVDDYKKIQQDPEYASQVRQDPAEYGNPKKNRQGKAKESAEAQFESWADNIVEQKPYVSLSPHGLYSVLDMDGESAYSTNSKILAYDYLKKNFDQLAGITIEPPIEEDADQPMIIDGKEVDESTIEYDMQDYGDLIAPISDAKFIDGTDLTPEQQEELENSNWYAEWVMTDYNNSRVESAEQPVEEDAGDDALAQELAKYFQGIADGYPKDQHGDQEHEEMTSIADSFKTDGLQAGMNDINTSRFEFSSNPFDQDGSGDMDDDMMMLLKKHGVSAKMKGALAYLVKGSKAITNPEEETATEGNDETVAELDDKQRTASSLKYSSDPRVAYFDKMMKRYGPKLTELIIDYSHVISNNEQKGEEKLKKYGKGYSEFLDYYRQMHGVEEDFIDMLTTAVEEEEGLINFFYDRVEQAKKAGQFDKTSRLLDPDQTESAVQEGHYPHSKSFDKLYGINDKQQYKAMADDAQSMDMGEFMDTYSSVIDMAGDFWEDHQKTSESMEGELARLKELSGIAEDDDEDKVVIHSLDFDRKTGQGTMSATIYKDGKEINVAGSTPQELANEYIKNGVNYDDFRFSHTSDVDFPEEEEWNNGEYDDDAQGFINDTLEILKKQKVPAQEGNEFALAVQKAKAAGMRPGDKFTVGDKEYTLKDAIERAGLQLETFFNEDDDDYEGSSDDYEGSFEYEFTGDDGEMAWGKIHYKAVNGQVDPNSLQGESEYEGNAKVDDEYATYVIQPGGAEHDEALLAAQEDYDEIAMKMQSKFEQSAVQEDDDDEKHPLWGDWGTTPQEWSDTHVSNNDDIVIAIAKGQKPPQPELIDGYMDEQNDQWPENVRGGKYKTAQIVDIIGDTIGYKCRTLGYEYFSPIHDGEIDGMYKPTAEMIKDARAIVQDPEFAKARARASGGTTSEGNDELDRIKNLAGLGEKETVKEKDEPADVGLSRQAQDYAEKPDDEDEAEYAEPSEEHYKKALAAGYKGSYEDYVKEYGSFPEEFPKNEASKPDFLDLDKDGNKTEPMKKAVADKELSEILNLAGV